MIKTTIISVLAGVCFLIMPVAATTAVDPLQGPCTGVQDNPACQQDAAQQNPNADNPVTGPTGVIQTATNLIAILTGIVAVIMIIVSGLRFITSSGDPTKTKSARANMTSALIGLVIVVLAWAIISFTVQKFVQ